MRERVAGDRTASHGPLQDVSVNEPAGASELSAGASRGAVAWVCLPGRSSGCSVAPDS